MVDNPTQGPGSYRGHGSLESMTAIIKNVAGSVYYDITNMIIDIAIYEDIFAPTLYGHVLIQDAVNMMNGLTSDNSSGGAAGFPIVGEEFLEITYKVTGFDEVFRRFAVYAIKNIDINKSLTMRKYVIEFCSEENLIDSITLVQKSYRDFIHVMAKDIMKEYLRLEDRTPGGKQPKNYVSNVQPTKGQQNIVIPNISPIESLKMLADRAVSNSFTSSTYLFFENRNGFNFCDIEYMINRGKEQLQADRPTYQYYYRNPNTPTPISDSPTQTIQDDSTGYKTIISMEQKSKFDTIEKIRRGYFESEALVYDFINNSFTSNNFKFVNKYRDYNTLGSATERSYPENSLDFIRNVTANEFEGASASAGRTSGILGFFGVMQNIPAPGKHTKLFMVPKDSQLPDTFIDDVLVNKASYMTRFAQNMFTVQVYGDPRITAGDVILIDLPEVIGTTRSNIENDVFLSGYFMVTTIQHVLTPETYMCTYDLFKNGFSSPVIPQAGSEVPQAADTSRLNTFGV